jgi:hypothetical protein
MPSRSVDSLLIKAARAGGRSIGVAPKVILVLLEVIWTWSKHRVLMLVAVWALGGDEQTGDAVLCGQCIVV